MSVPAQPLAASPRGQRGKGHPSWSGPSSRKCLDWRTWVLDQQRPATAVPPPSILAPPPEPLSRFEIASRELLDARALLRRTDTKFLFPRSALDLLLAQLEEDYLLVLSEGERVAHYRSLYFDDRDRNLYHAHRRRRRDRHKVRIREYRERRCAFLEIKTKDKYNVTSKIRERRDPGNFELDSEDRTLIQETLGETAANLSPALWISFPRFTLVGRDTEERLTIDLGLSLQSEKIHVHLPKIVIAEVKQAGFRARTPAMLAIRSSGIRPGSASKYCAGIALTRLDPRTQFLAPLLRDLVRHHDV